MPPALLQALLGLPDVGGPLPVCNPDFPVARVPSACGKYHFRGWVQPGFGIMREAQRQSRRRSRPGTAGSHTIWM